MGQFMSRYTDLPTEPAGRRQARPEPAIDGETIIAAISDGGKRNNCSSMEPRDVVPGGERPEPR